MADEKIERVYTVPLGAAYTYVRTKRARRAVSLLRTFAAKHMKAHQDDVRLSEQLNEHVWARSMQKPPRRVKVKIVKEGGLVKVSLLDEKPKPARKVKTPTPKKAKPAAKAPEKDAKPAPKKEEKAPAKKAEPKEPAKAEKKDEKK